MPSPIARPLLHTVHLLTFVVLLATGLLLFIPDLRAAATGGYSLFIREAHLWVGVAFLVLPLLVIIRYGTRSILVAPADLTLRTRLKGLHLVVTVLLAALLTLSGFALWADSFMPDAVLDASRSLHDWLTYAAIFLLAIHILEVGVAALVERLGPASASMGTTTDKEASDAL